tara:strand:- start:161 stop:1522 length:1362 start_codon:yes stop_codon:yes gene_type:complete
MQSIMNRREMLRRSGLGCGLLALHGLMAGSAPVASRPHFPATAKNVIWLFMHGGPSQMDTFDPKPLLQELHGKQAPDSFHDIQTSFTHIGKQKLMGSEFAFSKCGASGIEISDGFRHMQRHADDIAVLRSLHHEDFNHNPALWKMNCGHNRAGRPALGSWLSYGLGREADNLPGFVVMTDGAMKAGGGVWGNAFLPASHQGTKLNMAGPPVPNLQPAMTSEKQLKMLHYMKQLDAGTSTELEARIKSYELAFRMQTSAPEALDLNKESRATRALYGNNRFSQQCLMARRLVERGVRMVQVYNGCASGDEWDTHHNNFNRHKKLMRNVDQGCSGLLADLKSRGMLEDTLVIWSGEFGRTPTTEKSNGRDHNPYGFCGWMAGGGVQGGQVIGATDEIGFRAAEDKVHVHDFHATVLKLMGLDHEALSVNQNGLEMRLTDLHGYHDVYGKLTGRTS